MGVYLNGGFFMNTEFNKTQVIKYLAFTFGIAYAIQIIAWLLYSNGQQMIGQLIVAVMMFVPMLSVLLSGGKIKSMGWNPHIKQNWKTIHMKLIHLCLNLIHCILIILFNIQTITQMLKIKR